jgi:hypothetical protein
MKKTWKFKGRDHEEGAMRCMVCTESEETASRLELMTADALTATPMTKTLEVRRSDCLYDAALQQHFCPACGGEC